MVLSPQNDPAPTSCDHEVQRLGVRRGGLRSAVLLAVIVVPLTLFVRWGLGERTGGPHMDPRPDALEYAAAAQGLALEGHYCLHVGPHDVRPRYAPGWPMVIAVAITAGMKSESLWHLSGLFSAAHASLLAIISAYGVRLFLRSRPQPMSERAIARRALIAGLLAGCGWAFTPLSIEWTRNLMSDEPAAFLGTAALFAMPVALFGEMRQRPARWTMAAAGLAAGCAMAMRPVMGYLLIGPALIFLVGGAIRLGRWRAMRLGGCGVAALLLSAAPVMGILHTSGHSPWEWSGYRFWLPELYGQLDKTFNVDYALHGHPSFALHDRNTNRQLGNLEVAEQVFLGLRSLPKDGNRGLGRYWPIAGWACGAALLWAGWRGRDPRRLFVLTWGAAVACWIAGHIAVFSLYFYPATRFYLAPLAWCWVGLAVACAVWCGGSRLRIALSGYLAVSSFWFLFMDCKPLLRRTTLGQDPEYAAVQETFNKWLALSDSQRAARPTPFDPVQVQAMGLLTPDALSRIEAWGTLPSTEHAWRLRKLGYSETRSASSSSPD